METSQFKNIPDHVCDLNYLDEIMGGKQNLILEIIDVFLKQVPQELSSLNDAISKADFAIIKSISHTMKSSVSILGIEILKPILQEMESLGGAGKEIERIKVLYIELNKICKQALLEMEKTRLNYV